MEKLFSGRTPTKKTLDAADKLNWWTVHRCTGGLSLRGMWEIRPPGLGATLHVTGPICWMDAGFRWCRCEDGWLRLGEWETEIDMDLILGD
jgi:hypothetical protein